MSEKALGMLKHMRMQIFGHPAPYVVVRGAALSIGVDPSGSECDGLVDELLQAGYIQSLEDQIAFLRRELERKDAILLNLTERIPELEASSEASAAPETAEEEPERAEPRPAAGGTQEGVQRPWWRRLFA